MVRRRAGGLVIPTSLPQSVLGTLDGSGKELVGLAVATGEDGLVRVIGPGPLRTHLQKHSLSGRIERHAERPPVHVLPDGHHLGQEVRFEPPQPICFDHRNPVWSAKTK
jgi:hypothetical protein